MTIRRRNTKSTKKRGNSKRGKKRGNSKRGKKKSKRGNKKSKRGNKKSKRGKKKRSRKSKSSGGLGRWFAEEWIDVCTGKPCGRKSYSTSGMPYCRPKRRINKGTPRTARSLSNQKIREMCRKKRKNPTSRMKKV